MLKYVHIKYIQGIEENKKNALFGGCALCYIFVDKANDSLVLINYKASEEVGLQLLDHELLDYSPT